MGSTRCLAIAQLGTNPQVQADTDGGFNINTHLATKPSTIASAAPTIPAGINRLRLPSTCLTIARRIGLRRAGRAGR